MIVTIKIEVIMKTTVVILLITLGMLTKTGKFETDFFKTKDGKELRITFIKHGSLMFEYDGKINQPQQQKQKLSAMMY